MTTDDLADALVVLVGVVNIVPGLAATVSVGRAAAAYGVTLDGPDLAVVLRHRGVLLAIVGLALVVVPWWPQIRTAAVMVGVVSMASFVLIVLAKPRVGRPLRTVMWVDLGALGLLLLAVLLRPLD